MHGQPSKASDRIGGSEEDFIAKHSACNKERAGGRATDATREESAPCKPVHHKRMEDTRSWRAKKIDARR